ncbi:universal stress protein [Agrobacterium tumefaciens]|uniref:Universal stress protein n=1 Tax=Agrobacterium tumefaciens TaxID=358 RepID=A0A0D0JQK7_AGRTU|nr:MULTISPECIES: universal stress protein [Rhizobium]KIP97648.1 universal stress protein [Agrobacterium tumefaciens]MCI9868121.1 universal stress protein [Rhizobium skierniewicense]
MSIKTVLCPVEANSFRNDVENAIAFCRLHDAHLSVLVVYTSAPTPIGSYDVISTVWIAEREREIGKLAEVKTRISDMLVGCGVSGDVQDLYAEFAWATEEIAERAMYSDIVFIGSEAAAVQTFRRHVVDGALFESPTALLIDNRRSNVPLQPKTILLAWDSSNEVARAAQQALGFLQAAERVHITLIDPVASSRRNGEEPGADVATYLSRHKVNITVERIASGGRAPADVLRMHARDISAEMLVMGAFNHPRLQQRIFGGVSLSMLNDPTLPLFLSH